MKAQNATEQSDQINSPSDPVTAMCLVSGFHTTV
jgi:hypothetical protein